MAKNTLIKVLISDRDLTKLFKDNKTLKSKDNILYFEKLKGGI